VKVVGKHNPGDDAERKFIAHQAHGVPKRAQEFGA